MTFDLTEFDFGVESCSMTHSRTRSCENSLKKDLSFSPCVGLLGMRQVGKTTLLKKYSTQYLSFDDPQTAIDFERGSRTFSVQSGQTMALDEIQKYPPAFDILKLNIDELKKPGRFIVSGSVRFASRKQIRESLTGRIVLIEIHPFTLAECHSKPESSFLKSLLEDDKKSVVNLKKRAWVTSKEISHYMQTGGLPGICFRRDETIRNRLFQTHLDTLLSRDIHLVKETSLSPQKLFSLLTVIAKNQGAKISLANYARLVGVSQPTIKSVFHALEALFLIKPFGHTYFIEDAGLSHFLHPQNGPLTLWDRIRLLHYHFRVQLTVDFPSQMIISSYESRGGLFVPFLIEHKAQKKLAIFVEESGRPSNKLLMSATLIKKKFPKIKPIILFDGQSEFESAKGILCLPWQWVF